MANAKWPWNDYIDEDEPDPPTTVLIVKAKAGDVEAVRACLKNGAKADFSSSLALRAAAFRGHTEVVEILIAAGARVQDCNNEAIIEAASGGHAETVAMLIRHGADPNAREGEPLTDAAARNDEEMVKTLLENGADVHVLDNQPLRRAAFHGHIEVLVLLLSRGADPFAYYGSSLSMAESQKHEEVAEVLRLVMDRQKKVLLQDMSATDDFLFAPYRDTDEIGIVRAVSMGLLQEVLDQMQREGKSFSKEILHGPRTKGGYTLSDLIIMQPGAMIVFSPEHWGGDLDAMRAGWDSMPKMGIALYNLGTPEAFEEIVTQHKIKKLRQTGNRFKMPKK